MSDLPVPAPETAPVATGEPHELLARLLELPQQPLAKQFLGGLRLAGGSAKFLFKHPGLWPSAAIPAAINFFLFLAIAGLLLWNNDLFSWAKPLEAASLYWLKIVLWWVWRVLLFPLLVILAYLMTVMLGGVVAGPFNDALSERLEHRLQGNAVPAEEGLKALVHGGFRGVITAAATTIPRVILVIGLGLIPGIGPIIAGIVGAFFLAVEYSDYSLERRKWGLRQKVRTVWKYRRVALGWGVGTNLMLIVPLLNFVVMPVAVVGGTALALAMERWESDAEAETPAT